MTTPEPVTLEQVDLANIQGGFLRAYGSSYSRAAFVVLHFPAPGPGEEGGIRPGQCWLRHVLEAQRITTAESRPSRTGGATFNVMLSYQGLQALGQPLEALRTFPPEFAAGMAARAEQIGDTGASAPEGWDWIDGEAQQRVHALVSIYCPAGAGETARDDQLLLEREVQKVWAEARATGVEVVATQYAARLPESREHFGFVDGISQPEVAVAGLDTRPGGGALQAHEPRRRLLRKPLPPPPPYWRRLKAGEFLLGRKDEDDQVSPCPGPEWLGRDGTYVVYRKLRQYVGLFRRLVKERSAALGVDPRALEAKLVGRDRNGHPAKEDGPGHPEPYQPPAAPAALSGTAASTTPAWELEGTGQQLRIAARDGNNLRFNNDPNGHGCPLGAHIRRANPRDTCLQHGTVVARHRIIRRGIPFGPPLPEGRLDGDGHERGMIFICMQASISRQFEFVQSQWLNDGDVFRLGDDKDVLAGDHGGTGKMTIQGCPPRFVSALPRLVTVRGGEYFFLPSMRALRGLAGLPEPAPPGAAL
ncbi:MAG TPA: hypothetical protein VHQ00_05730 [Chloroflexota bacterium]|nr:hypothetical protein [Chloroflexota bacterium]